MSTPGHILDLPVHDLSEGSSPFLVRNIAHVNGYDFTKKHRHSYYEILFFENGGGRQLIDFVEYPVRDHSCFIVHPNQVHLLEREAGSNGRLIQFRSVSVHSDSLFSLLRKRLWNDASALVFENDKATYDRLSALLSLFDSGASDPIRNERNQQLLQLILFDLLRDQSPSNDQGTDKQFSYFIQLIDGHFLEEHGVQFYLDRMDVSSKKLAQLCKQHSGLSPLKVLHHRRLLEAKRLLLFGESSQKEICYYLGFENPANFSAFVRKNTGLTPTDLQTELEEMHKGKS